MSSTKIGWCTKTWNPVTGCSRVSVGCDRCYARRFAERLAGLFGYPQGQPFTPTVHYNRFDEPLKWKKPQRIFISSMGDLFHYDFYIKRDIYERIEKVITACPQHTFFMLTKRPNSMNDLVSEIFNKNRIVPNLWVGVSAENQEYAQLRIPQLLEIPAAKHFVSIEPMLGSVDITPFLSGENKLDWVICGQETGTNARPLKEEWFINLYRQCEKFKVPIYVKSPLYESFPKYMNVFQRRDS